jgi:hypothetical protein
MLRSRVRVPLSPPLTLADDSRPPFNPEISLTLSLRWLATAWLLGLSVLMMLSPVLAQSRAIPVEARRSKIAPYNTSYLLVENQRVRLLPGARVYSEQNRSMTPSKVPQDVIARIRYNDTGEIREVWILTPEEIARQDPNPENARRPGRSPIAAPAPTPAPEIPVAPTAPVPSSP